MRQNKIIKDKNEGGGDSNSGAMGGLMDVGQARQTMRGWRMQGEHSLDKQWNGGVQQEGVGQQVGRVYGNINSSDEHPVVGVYVTGTHSNDAEMGMDRQQQVQQQVDMALMKISRTLQQIQGEYDKQVHMIGNRVHLDLQSLLSTLMDKQIQQQKQIHMQMGQHNHNSNSNNEHKYGYVVVDALSECVHIDSSNRDSHDGMMMYNVMDIGTQIDACIDTIHDINTYTYTHPDTCIDDGDRCIDGDIIYTLTQAEHGVQWATEGHHYPDCQSHGQQSYGTTAPQSNNIQRTHTNNNNHHSIYDSDKYSTYIQHLRSQLRHKGQEIRQMERVHGQQTNRLQCQLSERVEQVCALGQQLRQQQNRHGREVLEMGQQYNRREEQYRWAIQELKADIHLCNTRWADAETRCAQAQAAERRVLDNYHSAQAELDSKTRECSTLYDNYDGLLARLNAYMRIISSKQKQQHNNQDVRTSAESEYGHAHDDYTCAYQQLQSEYIQQMAHRIHKQHKLLKSQQLELNRLKRNINQLDQQLSCITHKYQDTIQHQQNKIQQLQSTLQHYHSIEHNQIHIYVQQEMDYLRAEVVNLERRLQDKNREIRAMWVKASKGIWKRMYAKGNNNSNNNDHSRDNSNDSIISGQCGQDNNRKQKYNKMVEYQQHIILNTLKNTGTEGHSCQLSKLYALNSKQYMRIQASIAKQAMRGGGRQRDGQLQDKSGKSDIGQGMGKQVGSHVRCTQCKRILASCLRVCKQFNQIICDQTNNQHKNIAHHYNDKSYRNGNQRTIKNHRLITIAKTTQDDLLLYCGNKLEFE